MKFFFPVLTEIPRSLERDKTRTSHWRVSVIDKADARKFIGNNRRWRCVEIKKKKIPSHWARIPQVLGQPWSSVSLFTFVASRTLAPFTDDNSCVPQLNWFRRRLHEVWGWFNRKVSSIENGWSIALSPHAPDALPSRKEEEDRGCNLTRKSIGNKIKGEDHSKKNVYEYE